MAWNDRILTATYISPSGLPFVFQYENVSVESDKKTATFIFPEVDGALIQDLGRAGRRYPFLLFFSGEDYDIISDGFLTALEEKGVATIIHPKYGVRSVIPTGTITRRDDLLTEANQAAFSFTLSETLTGLTFPASIENVVSIIAAALTLFQTASSDQFATDIVTNTASEIIELEQKFEAQRFIIENAFSLCVKNNDELNSAFQIVNNSLTENISNIEDDPDIVSSQLITFMRLPSKSIIDITETISLYNSVISLETATIYEPSIASKEPDNNFSSALVQAYSAIISACESVLDAEFKTRTEAISVSETILDILDSLKTWQDANITSLGVIDTGESYDTMLNVVSLTTAYLIDLSFDLPSEKILLLDEETNIIPLVSELYGDLDKLDFFIQTNNLTVDEIETLPLGKVVVYYA